MTTFDALAAFGSLVLLLPAVAALRPLGVPPRASEEEGPSSYRPSLSVIKPIGGPFPYDRLCLESFFRTLSDYPGRCELVFSLQGESEPVRSMIETLRRAYPSVGVQVVVRSPEAGLTAKGSNLVHGADVATGEVLLLSDSDMVLEGAAQLYGLIDPLRIPKTVVTAMVRHTRTESLGAVLYGMAMNMVLLERFLPLVYQGNAPGVAGGTVALRREALTDLGGLRIIGSYIADDLALGAQLKERGYRIVPGPLLSSPVGRVPIGRWLDLMSRGMVLLHTMGQRRDRIQTATLFAQEGLWVLLGALAPSPITAGGFVLSWLLRLLSLRRLYRTFGIGSGVLPGLLLPVFDLVGLGYFVAKGIRPTVSWAGVRYLVGPDGRIKR